MIKETQCNTCGGKPRRIGEVRRNVNGQILHIKPDRFQNISQSFMIPICNISVLLFLGRGGNFQDAEAKLNRYLPVSDNI